MKNHLTATFVYLLLLTGAPVPALAALQIFACEPEWASLAQEIGGDRVNVFSATSARQDPHHIRARPSLLAAMRRADLVICSGASLEVGWLPVLLQKAGRENVQPGRTGHLLAASQVPVLDKPERLDRADGDIHPEGNPHVHLDPHNISLVATALVQRLQALDPANSMAYQTRYDTFNGKWQQATRAWEESAASLRGMPVVVHHNSFAYLLNWLGLRELASLEPKPGIPPTTAHLESLLQSLKAAPARMILRTPYDPDNASRWLAEKTGIAALELPYTVGGDKQSNDLFSLFDGTIALLHGALDAQ